MAEEAQLDGWIPVSEYGRGLRESLRHARKGEQLLHRVHEVHVAHAYDTPDIGTPVRGAHVDRVASEDSWREWSINHHLPITDAPRAKERHTHQEYDEHKNAKEHSSEPGKKSQAKAECACSKQEQSGACEGSENAGMVELHEVQQSSGKLFQDEEGEDELWRSLQRRLHSKREMNQVQDAWSETVDDDSWMHEMELLVQKSLVHREL